jgi:hypothetical protein
MKAKAIQFLAASSLTPIVQEGKEPGWKWEVVVFRFGKSQVAPHFVYTKEAALKSMDKINGARVYANSTSDLGGHKRNPNEKVTRDIVGVLTDPVVTETELKATLNILPSGAWLRENLLHTFQNNLPLPYELSIDAIGKAYQGSYEGETLPIAERFDRFDVDIVERGAAGGRIVKMAASQHTQTGDTMLKTKLATLFLLLYPQFLESKKLDLGAIDENELFTHLLEADKAQPRLHLPDGAQLTEDLVDTKLKEFRAALTSGTQDALDAALRRVDALLGKSQANPAPTQEPNDSKFRESLDRMNAELAAMKRQACAALLNAKLQESRLPIPLQEEVRAQFKEGNTLRVFEESELDAAIKRVRETYSKFVATIPNSGGLDIRMGHDEIDKVKLGIDGFFLEGSRIAPLTAEERKTLLHGVPPFRSFKEAYIQFTGDVDVTGLKAKSTRMTESLATGDWAQVVADAMNKRLVRDYTQMGLDAWRTFVDVVPLRDFKTQHRIRYGGYPNLPIRPESQSYQSLTSPTDEEATYVPATRGGTEDITRELILNDDVGAIQKIPTRLARAAAQTLHEFVFDFIRPGVNPTIYDTLALYHATHANIGTAALDATALAAARLRMKKQTMKDNNKRLGIRAGYLVVPSDLEAVADALLTPAAGQYNNVPTFLQKQNMAPIVVDYWTDGNDWVLVARPEDVVGIEIGFINGQETPELFVSDIANVGSWFTNDKLTYKIRHEYGGNIIDFRAFDGSIVA